MAYGTKDVVGTPYYLAHLARAGSAFYSYEHEERPGENRSCWPYCSLVVV